MCAHVFVSGLGSTRRRALVVGWQRSRCGCDRCHGNPTTEAAPLPAPFPQRPSAPRARRRHPQTAAPSFLAHCAPSDNCPPCIPTSRARCARARAGTWADTCRSSSSPNCVHTQRRLAWNRWCGCARPYKFECLCLWRKGRDLEALPCATAPWRCAYPPQASSG